LSIGRTLLLILVVLALVAIVYTGIWQVVPLFIWQHPMLSWLPILAVIAVGFLGKLARAAGGPDTAPLATAPATAEGAPAAPSASVQPVSASVGGTTGPPRKRPRFWWGGGLLAGFVVLLAGLFYTLISPPAVGLDDIEYEVVDALPERTQPRLLPRAGVRDDPSFRDAAEIHLVRDPSSGELAWSGEWQSNWLGAASAGVAVRPLDDVISQSEIIRTGFEHSVGGITPSTLKGQAKIRHPFSHVQYPVLVPNGDEAAFAMAPYVGYRGFPFRQPYLKGVLVYHQDGTIEDLTPEEAAARPELVRTGRIIPESVARAEAQALARSDEIDGEINDGEDNRQPFLTAIDRERTVWLTVINSKEQNGGVNAVVLSDSSTGETEVWIPPEGQELISTEDVLNEARALPLRWEEERCCDSDGHSYTVDLRHVVEPRLAFKNGKPFYLVTVVPTDDLALQREVEYTLLIDARTGEKLDQFDHVNEGLSADARLQKFFLARN